MSLVGDRLKEWRESIPRTLDELAIETGIPKSTLGYLETKAKNISEDIQEKLKVYGAPMSWIILGEGRPVNLFTIREPKPSYEVMTAGEAAQRASAIQREVLAAAPHLREKWTDDDKDEFLGGVAQILTSVPRSAVENTLRQLLLAVAKGTTMKRSGTPEDAGSAG